MARLLERFVKELAVDGTEDGRPLAGRQGSKVSFNRLGELDRVGHPPPSLASLPYYRASTGLASVRRTITVSSRGEESEQRSAAACGSAIGRHWLTRRR